MFLFYRLLIECYLKELLYILYKYLGNGQEARNEITYLYRSSNGSFSGSDSGNGREKRNDSQNPKNNVMKQSEVEQKSDSDMQNEKEAVVEEATDSIEEVAQTDSAAITAQMCSPAGQYPVMGESVVTVDELADYFNQSGYEYPSEELAKGGADTIETFCQIYCEEAEAEDIRAEVAFTQAMKETGFLQFGGDVSVEQFNFAGIGTTGGGVPGNSYPDVRTGVRAQIQHLKAYATDEPLNQTCVDNRYEYVKKASAPYVQWLGQKENPEGAGWATGENYGYDIAGMLQHLLLKEQG